MRNEGGGRSIQLEFITRKHVFFFAEVLCYETTTIKGLIRPSQTEAPTVLAMKCLSKDRQTEGE
jgi:hypothetical protein